jgi:hypothetical protein
MHVTHSLTPILTIDPLVLQSSPRRKYLKSSLTRLGTIRYVRSFFFSSFFLTRDHAVKRARFGSESRVVAGLLRLRNPLEKKKIEPRKADAVFLRRSDKDAY